MQKLWARETTEEMAWLAKVYTLEILKRAKGDSGDIVSFSAKEDDLRDEVNRRTAKAGYTTRHGEPVSSGRIIIQPPNAKYRKNYRRIFGHD